MSRAISSGDLDITTDNASTVIAHEHPIIHVSPESGTADTLDTITISNAFPIGGVVHLVNITGNTITITHNSGAASGLKKKIITDDGNSVVLTGTEAIELFFDIVQDAFHIIGTGTSNLIEQGNSKVEVLDAGTGAINFFVDGVVTSEVIISNGAVKLEDAFLDMDSHTIDNVLDIFGPSTDEFIDMSTGSQITIGVSAGDNIGFRFATNERFTMQDGVFLIADERVVKSASGFCAFMVGSTSPGTMSNSANVGAIGAPYKADTTDSPTSTTLNNWFGDQNGCFGFQFDSDGATAADKYRIWAKLDDTWHKWGAVA